MPNTHIHNFQQVYFIKEGTMTLLYGVTPQGEIARYQVPPHSFVVIPPGVVHAHINDGSNVQRHGTWSRCLNRNPVGRWTSRWR